MKLLSLILLCSIFSSPIEATTSFISKKNQPHINQSIVYAKGARWRCKGCGGYNYSETADWKGKYYCVKCDTSKTDD